MRPRCFLLLALPMLALTGAGCGEEVAIWEIECADELTRCGLEDDDGALTAMTCADLSSHPDHCGACGEACGLNQRCDAGECVDDCPVGEARCDDRCIDLSASRDACGSCGNACAPSFVCDEGACAPSCGSGRSYCGDDAGCVSLSSDPEHCGECGAACADGRACVRGACTALCLPPLAVCEDEEGAISCVDLTSSPGHCGACGAVCAEDATCRNGVCVQDCILPLQACDDECIDPFTDEQNCGACGTTCSSGEVCRFGLCVAACDDTRTVCDDRCVDLSTDPEHCSGCGEACRLDDGADGRAICVGGRCDVDCLDGGADCNGDPTDGCEADLATDDDHCGACGEPCAPPNADGACFFSECQITSCDEGFVDCDGEVTNGCEAQLAADADNCSACGAACDRGFVCDAGACVPECIPARARCDDACFELSTSPRHCGACGDACPSGPQSTPTCAGGVCGLTCDEGFGDCDGNPATGCEQELDTAEHCGGCDVRCLFDGALGRCEAGACVLDRCTGLSLDCDGDSDNGCEIDGRVDSIHCGACDARCPEGTVCSNGFCETTCAPPLIQCRDRCRDPQSDPEACGGCTTECTAGNHARPICVSSSCRALCEPGFGDCDGDHENGCEVDLTENDDHCGACGDPCDVGESCMDGECVR